MEESKKTKAEFNENAFKISRLHNSWLDVQKYRKNCNYKSLKITLDSIEAELYYDAKKLDKEIDKEEDKYVKRLKKINTEIKNSIKKLKLEEVYDNYFQKEIILREIQQESGMGSTYKPEDEDEFD